NKILVHEEVTVPKPSEFAANRSYIGTVNDIDVTKNIVLDDTDPQKDVIHFMISKPTVIQIAEQVNNKSGQSSSSSSDELMKFTLQPGGIGASAAAATGTHNASSNQTPTQQARNSISPSPSSTSTVTTTTSKPMEK